MSNEPEKDKAVILFDGLCNLCSSTVQFVIKHDPAGYYQFASLQSEFGLKILHRFNLSATELNSFVLYKNGKIFTRSTGALLVAKNLQGGWKALTILLLVPAFIRNGVYNFISRNRYRWFGKKTTCWLPSTNLQSRFIS